MRSAARLRLRERALERCRAQLRVAQALVEGEAGDQREPKAVSHQEFVALAIQTGISGPATNPLQACAELRHARAPLAQQTLAHHQRRRRQHREAQGAQQLDRYRAPTAAASRCAATSTWTAGTADRAADVG